MTGAESNKGPNGINPSGPFSGSIINVGVSTEWVPISTFIIEPFLNTNYIYFFAPPKYCSTSSSRVPSFAASAASA